jgi:hypothetical protein
MELDQKNPALLMLTTCCWYLLYPNGRFPKLVVSFCRDQISSNTMLLHGNSKKKRMNSHLFLLFLLLYQLWLDFFVNCTAWQGFGYLMPVRLFIEFPLWFNFLIVVCDHSCFQGHFSRYAADFEFYLYIFFLLFKWQLFFGRLPAFL